MTRAVLMILLAALVVMVCTLGAQAARTTLDYAARVDAAQEALQ